MAHEHEASTAYEAHLVEARHAASRDLDRTLVTVAGGALGLSFALVGTLDGPLARLACLTAGWWALGAALLLVLVSYFTSKLALGRAISQVQDNGITEGERPGGWLTVATAALSAASVVAVTVGLFCIGFFLAGTIH